mgnify:CR=1 FL=1
MRKGDTGSVRGVPGSENDLQPLVENAILHGLEGCENGYICIYAGREGDVLNISITDNGCGMSPEILAWINSPEPEKRDGTWGFIIL